MIQDKHTYWLRAYAFRHENTECTVQGFQNFLGPKTKVEHVYTDGSKEFKAAMKQLQYSHDCSTPHTPQTNGVAERAVRKVKESTSCALGQSGLSAEWWSEAQNCFCFLYTVTEVMHDGYTSYQSRLLRGSEGPLIPSGAYVKFVPATPEDLKSMDEFGPKDLDGIFSFPLRQKLVSQPDPGERRSSTKISYGHARKCVDRYVELAQVSDKTLRKVATPNLDDHQFRPEEFESKGRLSPVASKIVLTVLYLARFNRPGILWTVKTLAREVDKWTIASDKRPHRLISYINCTIEYQQTSFMGDPVHKCITAMFVDACFAGDLRDSKSASGIIMYLLGPCTCVPLGWMCKKQGSQAHSSTEAEVISLDTGLRMEGIPALTLCDTVVTTSVPNAPKLPSKILTSIDASELLSETCVPAGIIANVLAMIEWVPPNVPPARLVIREDNDAVIKFI